MKVKFPTYWTMRERIEFLQRTVLIHSYLYYEQNTNLISDSSYDELAKQLVELQKGVCLYILQEISYYYVFYDFDGTTDFDLEQMLKDNVYCRSGKNRKYITKWWKGEIRHWTVNDGIWKE